MLFCLLSLWATMIFRISYSVGHKTCSECALVLLSGFPIVHWFCCLVSTMCTDLLLGDRLLGAAVEHLPAQVPGEERGGRGHDVHRGPLHRVRLLLRHRLQHHVAGQSVRGEEEHRHYYFRHSSLDRENHQAVVRNRAGNVYGCTKLWRHVPHWSWCEGESNVARCNISDWLYVLRKTKWRLSNRRLYLILFALYVSKTDYMTLWLTLYLSIVSNIYQ